MRRLSVKQKIYSIFIRGIACEEELNIKLLDERLNLVGAAHVARSYATGGFSRISIGEPSAIYFRFSDKLRW